MSISGLGNQPGKNPGLGNTCYWKNQGEWILPLHCRTQQLAHEESKTQQLALLEESSWLAPPIGSRWLGENTRHTVGPWLGHRQSGQAGPVRWKSLKYEPKGSKLGESALCLGTKRHSIEADRWGHLSFSQKVNYFCFNFTFFSFFLNFFQISFLKNLLSKQLRRTAAKEN